MDKSLYRSARTAGFTLVEIMIGLLIGLIGIVVIMETYAVSEGYRRTTTSGTDAQVNGAIATYLMQRELRDAGYNLQPYVTAGCMSVILWEENLGKSRWVRFVPVEINPAGYNVGDVNTDVILISYGNADTSVAGINAGTGVTSDIFTIRVNPSSYRAGDYVFTMQPSAVAGGPPSCVAHEATNVPTSPGNCGQAQPPLATGYQIEHKYRQYPNYSMGCQLVQANHNPSGVMKDPNGVAVPALDLSKGGQLFSMGPNPSAKIYAIRGGNLTVCETFAKDCTDGNNYDVLVNDIVSMRAILGGDYVGGTGTGAGVLGDGSIDQWSRNAFADSGDVRRTVAIAIELTARSGLKEKSSTGNPDPAACDATTAANLPDKGQTQDWYAGYVAMALGSLDGAKIDLSQSDPKGQWQCYRYKLFQSVVPLRNLLWTPG
jgi:type IV pilus assembly protein PilW